MKVRMTQQLQGTRDGQPWPAPGNEVDLPDAEARSLISGGSAVEAGYKSATILVPPMGVHTPGTTAMGGGSPLVAAPADAVSDPAAATKAAQDAASGNYATAGPAGIAHQHASGLAHTPESLQDAAKAQEETEQSLGAAAPPKVGEPDQPSGKSTGSRASDKK